MLKRSWTGWNYAVFPAHLLPWHQVAARNVVNALYPFTPQAVRSCIGHYRKLCEDLKVCESRESFAEARKIHARVIVFGLAASTFLQNHLLKIYSVCGSLEDARRVFRRTLFRNAFSWNAMIDGLSAYGRLDEARALFVEMPHKDACSWNTMMSGAFRNGEYEETLKLFVSMLQSSSLQPNSISFSCAMKACGALRSPGLGLQLHGLVIKFGFLGEAAIEISILDIYVKCGFMDLAAQQFEFLKNPDIFCWNIMILGLSRLSSSLERARELFHRIPERNIVSWNTMISSLHQHGHRVEALSMFAKLNREGFEPDAMTYACALRACASIPDAVWGRHLHARIIRLRSIVDTFVGSALVDMYANIGHLGAAKQTFHGLTEPDLASWTSITRGFVKSGFVKDAIILFNQMRKVPLLPDEANLVTVLGTCSSKDQMGLGIQLHSIAAKMGFDVSTVVANALTAMYAKTGSVHDAYSIFSSTPARDVVSWTTMITAHSHTGDLANALSTFRKMPERNVVTWNAMLASYMQNERREEGLKMYVLMLREAEARPDSITFTTLLCACAYLGVLRLGNQLFSQTAKFGVGSDVSVANASVKLYARCGRIEEAREIFDSINGKNLISWNTMITGYAQNGLGKKCMEAFESMLLTSTNPDRITFIGLLSACRHAGLVSEGKHYFASMMKHHNIFPGTEHIACMVDLLGRAGLLEEAKAMIDDMETEPTAEIWGALLNACKIYSRVELAENAMQNLLKLDLTHSGGYSLLTRIYADSGMSDAAAGVRKLMKDRGIRKTPVAVGWSSIAGSMFLLLMRRIILRSRIFWLLWTRLLSEFKPRVMKTRWNRRAATVRNWLWHLA